MDILLYNLFTCVKENYKTIFKSQSQSLLQLISVLPALERLYYLFYYLHIEKARIQSIENYIDYLATNPRDVESPQYKKDFWDNARIENSNFIHFLNQQIEIISLIDSEESIRISKMFENKRDFAVEEIVNVIVPSTLGYVSDNIFYLHESIKIRELVNLLIYLNKSSRLPKIYIKEDLTNLMFKHFNQKGQKLNLNTVKKYFNDVPKNLEKKLGELKNQFFTTEINNFLNKVLATDKKD